MKKNTFKLLWTILLCIGIIAGIVSILIALIHNESIANVYSPVDGVLLWIIIMLLTDHFWFK